MKNDKFVMSVGYDYEHFLFTLSRELFIGYFIHKGHKLASYKFLLKVLIELKKEEKIDSTFLFFLAFFKLLPKVFLQPLRLGSQKKMVPIPITLKKQLSLVFRWVVFFLREQKRRIASDEISDLLLWTLEEKGASWNQKKDYLKIATESRYLVKKYYK